MSDPATNNAGTGETITLHDVSGQAYTYPVMSGTIGPKVIDIRKLYADTDCFTYDPGFTSTASCESKITFIDGDEGVLLYRGYPIEQLAEKSDFMEVAYLLLYGELPKGGEKEAFIDDIKHHNDGARATDRLFPRVPARCPPHGRDVRRGGCAGGILS